MDNLIFADKPGVKGKYVALVVPRRVIVERKIIVDSVKGKKFMTANFTSPPWINKFFNFNIKQTYLTNILLLFLNLTSLYLNTLMPFFFKAFDTTFVEVLRLPLNYKGPHELHQLLTQTNTQCRASLGDILCRHIFPSLHLPDSPFAASESTLYLCCQGNYVRNKVKNVTYVHK